MNIPHTPPPPEDPNHTSNQHATVFQQWVRYHKNIESKSKRRWLSLHDDIVELRQDLAMSKPKLCIKLGTIGTCHAVENTVVLAVLTGSFPSRWVNHHFVFTEEGTAMKVCGIIAYAMSLNSFHGSVVKTEVPTPIIKNEYIDINQQEKKRERKSVSIPKAVQVEEPDLKKISLPDPDNDKKKKNIKKLSHSQGSVRNRRNTYTKGNLSPKGVSTHLSIQQQQQQQQQQQLLPPNNYLSIPQQQQQQQQQQQSSSPPNNYSTPLPIPFTLNLFPEPEPFMPGIPGLNPFYSGSPTGPSPVDSPRSAMGPNIPGSPTNNQSHFNHRGSVGQSQNPFAVMANPFNPSPPVPVTPNYFGGGVPSFPIEGGIGVPVGFGGDVGVPLGFGGDVGVPLGFGGGVGVPLGFGGFPIGSNVSLIGSNPFLNQQSFS